MSKVHIALTGYQALPVYQGIKYTSPDEVYYICSSATQVVAQRVSSFFTKSKNHCIRFEPADLKGIEKEVTKLKDSLKPDSEISINLVGGTKAWSLIFFDLFKDRASEIIIVDQNCCVWNVITKECTKLPEVGMKTRFKLNGCSPTQYKSLKEFDDSDSNAADILRDLWSTYRQRFTSLTSGLKENFEIVENNVKKSVSLSEFLKHESKGKITNGNDYFKFCKPDKVVFRFGNDQEVEVKSKNALRLATNTGWFEYKVARMLSRWGQAKEIWVGCEMTSNGAKDNDNPLNEFDVIIFTGTRMIFIECKTAIYKPTDIDKFANGVKRYGGQSSKGYFITYLPVSKTCTDKLKINKIGHFCLKTQSEEDIFEALNESAADINEF